MASSRPVKVAIYTFGCKVNLFESDQLKRSLKNIEIVTREEDADIFIINGCTVTSATDGQVRNMIRRFVKRGKVIVTGCYAKKPDPFLECASEVEFVNDISEVAQILGEELIYDAFFDRSRPFVKIQSGCDQFCSYCIIPFVRGSLKSVPLAEIRTLLEKIKDRQFKEVVLTGIHIGKYGKDLDDGSTLADVVKAAHETVGRVRLGSLESPEIDEQLFEYAKLGMILPHWHVPLQHGSDTVLKRMNRPYTTDEFKTAIDRIVSVYKELPAIGTDIITGFPGETDEEFKRSYDLIESLPFAYGHVFPFSVRAGTAAEKMDREYPVPSEVKKERAAVLRELFETKNEQFMRSLDGTADEVVIEEKLSETLFNSTSSKFQTVEVEGGFNSRDLIKVRLKYGSGKLTGTLTV
ncbi:MAG TPA: MiaB/RimO family radical SAM methylthiotransferase [bacterium]|nr:MiaB/RimO family radical SAM methylthiotransferase [bacterium]